ncbi:MAG: hypothetical protein KIS62_01750 [Ramlibacter sp.]|nr:hypothetical protein [Ramlibacter sp.]
MDSCVVSLNWTNLFRVRHGLPALLGLVGLAGGPAQAQTGLSLGALHAQGPLQPPAPGLRFGLSPALLPRFDRFDAPLATRAALTGWAVVSPRAALGLTLDSSTPRGTGLISSLDERSGAPRLDLGIRWRTALGDSDRIDVAAWRRVSPSGEGASLSSELNQEGYGTSVEWQFKSAPTFGFVPELRAIGLQLNGGGRLMLRTHGGRPVLYYRAQF